MAQKRKRDISMADGSPVPVLVVLTALLIAVGAAGYWQLTDNSDDDPVTRVTQGDMSYEVIIKGPADQSYELLLPIISDADAHSDYELVMENLQIMEGSGSFEIVSTKYGSALKVVGEGELRLEARHLHRTELVEGEKTFDYWVEYFKPVTLSQSNITTAEGEWVNSTNWEHSGELRPFFRTEYDDGKQIGVVAICSDTEGVELLIRTQCLITPWPQAPIWKVSIKSLETDWHWYPVQQGTLLIM